MAIKPPLSPVFPAALSNTTRQKKKSFLDKTKGETKTGLGGRAGQARSLLAGY